MPPNDEQQDVLLRLAQSQGIGVIHLPYTRAFEQICLERLGPNPSNEQKHQLWEALLQLRPSAEAEQSVAGPTLEPPAPPKMLEPTMPEAAPLFTTSGLGFPSTLFGDIPVRAQQPWTVPAEKALSVELKEARERMLSDIADSRMGTMEQRVAYLLNYFPETRDSDTALCIRYWKRFQADVLESWQPLELEVLLELDRLETIGRIRRHIQHDLCLFRGADKVTRNRDAFQRELYEYLAAYRGVVPETRFYLDETGNEGDKTYAGVAGICLINWQQYEKHHLALSQWRREQNWPEPIHFSETGSNRIDRALDLIAQLAKRRSGLLFLGYALQSRGRTHEDLFSLFIQLVIDSLRHLKLNGCLSEPRSLRVIKEADPGFDNIFLLKMQKQMSQLVAQEFPDQVIVQPIEPVIKGGDVLLECADLIAGGMQRRALMKGQHPKDRLAAAVFNLTGFEGAPQNGAIFKFHPAHT